jgi:hypothetical protein
MWVHGNAAQLQYPGGAGLVNSPNTPGHTMDQAQEGGQGRPWTDIVGLPTGPGKTFRGRGGNDNWFHFSIPTPCWRDGTRAELVMVGLLFTSDTAVPITGIMLFDGPRAVPFELPSMNLSGRHVDLVGNVNRFDFAPQAMYYGLGISVNVRFTQDGQITFHTVGGDFNV